MEIHHTKSLRSQSQWTENDYEEDLRSHLISKEKAEDEADEMDEGEAAEDDVFSCIEPVTLCQAAAEDEVFSHLLMDQTEINPTEMGRLIDPTEIVPSEISQGDNDYEEVQCLGIKLSDGAQKTKFLFSSACIYKVPKVLREQNESAYTPRLIAIGPLHRNDPHLQTPMQDVKLSYVNNLFCRLTKGKMNLELAKQKKFTVLRECMEAIKTSLDDAKKCYPEEVTLNVEMMLVDGCFILEFLYRYFSRNSEGLEADPIFANNLTLNTVQQDLVLLENQIPFLVLERLFSLTLARIPNLSHNLTQSGSQIPTDYVFLELVDRLMRPEKGESTNSTGSVKSSCWPSDCVLWVWGNKMNNSKPEEKLSSRNPIDYHHILHKLHDDYSPLDQTGRGVLSNYMPSASELVYAGVKFVPGTGNDLFKVKFLEPEGPFRWCRTARLEIPFLEIDDSTEAILRNFIAFEQCCPGTRKHFTSYAALMDMLVNSDKDVQVLEKAGVIHNWLGASEDVTNLFNNICKGVVIGEFLFGDTCKGAIDYSKRFWPQNMANLRSQYFASPWKFIAFCLGFFYFLITIAQLVVAIIN